SGGQRLLGDTFVAKLNATGSALIYSTYLGGSGSDDPPVMGNCIAVDGFGNAYVTGVTYSTDFPTVNPRQAALKGSGDAFVAKLNAVGEFIYSTYLGGSDFDGGSGIAVDESGDAYVTGQTASTDFPRVAPLQPAFTSDSVPFVAKLQDIG